MNIKLIQPPAICAISLEEAKSWLKISDYHDDDLISSLILSAQTYVEHYTRLKLISQKYEFTIKSNRVVDKIKLPFAPIISIDRVNIQDGDQSRSIDNKFWIINNKNDPTLILDINQFNNLNHNYEYSINATIGFGPSVSDVPEDIRLAIKILVAHYYSYRGDSRDQTQVDFKKYEYLLAAYKRLYL